MNNLEKIVLASVILILTVGSGFVIFAQDSKREAVKETSSMSHDMSSAPKESNEVELVDYTSEQMVRIDIDNSGYKIPNFKLTQDTTVVWTNRDSAEHTIMTGRMDGTQSHSNSSDADELSSPLLAEGENYSYIFDKIGDYSYHCSKHPSNTGSITVVASK